MSPDANVETCRFEHPFFARMEDLAFRVADSDGAPILLMPLGKTSAAVPLRSLQGELGIPSNTPDARMFTLVIRALEYVPELRPGDQLPLEVLGDETSWQPSDMDRSVAMSRLRLLLLAATEESGGPNWQNADASALLAAVEIRGMTERLEMAYAGASSALGVSRSEVLAMMDAMCAELSYIESLRERLLRRIQDMIARIKLLLASLVQNPPAIELVSRVLKLSGIGLAKVNARFDAVNACLQPLPPALAGFATTRDTVRQHRDWLHRSLRAWEPILVEWENVHPSWGDETSPLLARTYRFVAQRFMPVQEWTLANRSRRVVNRSRMVW